MIEKFSDYESVGFLDKEGSFVFEIKKAELKESKDGNPMWVFDVQADEGKSTIYHSLKPEARWSFNNLIKACLGLKTKEQIQSFECDYETIGQQLVGRTFVGKVEEDHYIKTTKVPDEDGVFHEKEEERISYKITSYQME